MKTYQTITEALEDLQERGFVYDFNLQKDILSCEEIDTVLKPSEFEVAESYRYGQPEAGNSTTVYAIQSRDGLKGILLNTNGAYSGSVSPEMNSRLKIDSREKN
jgi:hypothetical protein